MHFAIKHLPRFSLIKYYEISCSCRFSLNVYVLVDFMYISLVCHTFSRALCRLIVYTCYCRKHLIFSSDGVAVPLLLECFATLHVLHQVRIDGYIDFYRSWIMIERMLALMKILQPQGENCFTGTHSHRLNILNIETTIRLSETRKRRNSIEPALPKTWELAWRLVGLIAAAYLRFWAKSFAIRNSPTEKPKESKRVQFHVLSEDCASIQST